MALLYHEGKTSEKIVWRNCLHCKQEDTEDFFSIVFAGGLA